MRKVPQSREKTRRLLGKKLVDVRFATEQLGLWSMIITVINEFPGSQSQTVLARGFDCRRAWVPLRFGLSWTTAIAVAPIDPGRGNNAL